MIETFITALEKLLNVVNSKQRLIVLVIVTLLFSTVFLAYNYLQTQEVINELSSPRVERVTDMCYQQRIRRTTRIVGVQFPLPEYLIERGVEQNLSALVIPKEITLKEFQFLCTSLINEILDPKVEMGLLQRNPEWKRKLQEFYNNQLGEKSNPEPLREPTKRP